MLRKNDIYQPLPGWTRFLLKLVVALLLLAAVGHWTAAHFNWIAMRATPWLRIGALSVVGGACIVTYFGSLFVMGFRFADFKRESR
jgi:putative peptidoglycan lipid II flippase